MSVLLFISRLEPFGIFLLNRYTKGYGMYYN